MTGNTTGSAYTEASERAWRRIYSAMLTYILPTAVRHEIPHRDCPLLYCEPTACISEEGSNNNKCFAVKSSGDVEEEDRS